MLRTAALRITVFAFLLTAATSPLARAADHPASFQRTGVHGGTWGHAWLAVENLLSFARHEVAVLLGADGDLGHAIDPNG